MARRFALHSIIYRLVLGAVVLAVVIPVWASGHHPMWPVSVMTIVVVTVTGIPMARRPRLHGWLRAR